MSSLKAMAKDAKNKKSAPQKQKAKVPPPAFNLSTEFVQDSDEDEVKKSADESSSSNESLPANAAPALSKANGKVVTDTGSSSSGSGSESAEESGSEENGEEEEGSEESEEEDDDEEESLPSPNKVGPVTAAARQFQKENSPSTVAPKKPPPYKAPAGFEVKSIDAESNSSKLFKKSNLEGKQIWYITAPASVSIASIEQISLRDIKKGKKALSRNDNDYGFVQDTTEDKTYTKILVPSSSDEGYRMVSKPMDQVLRLQRIVRLPGMSGDENSVSRATVPAAKPIRPQPEGLRMRFRPMGFGKGKTGNIGSGSSSSSGSDSDEEMQDAPSAKRELVSPSADSSTTSSDASGEDTSSGSDVEMTDAPPQPLKKSSKSAESPAASRTLKRKHSEATKSKAKNSSSQSTTLTDHKQLKRTKTKKTESHKTMVDSQSMSTAASILPPQRISKTASHMPPPSTPKPKSSTSILPSSASSAPHSTSKATPIIPSKASSTSRSTIKSTPVPPPTKIIPSRSSETAAVHSSCTNSKNETPSRVSKIKMSLEEQIATIDSNLSAEQKNEEVKRLKRNESSRISKAKRRSSTGAPVERKVSVKVTPVPLPPQRSGINHRSPATGQNLPKVELNSALESESLESMERKEKRERKKQKKEKKQ